MFLEANQKMTKSDNSKKISKQPINKNKQNSKQLKKSKEKWKKKCMMKSMN
jgi:hypothetical protein